MSEGLNRLLEILNEAREEISRVMIGQREVIDQALICVFTGNHALIEGVPGLAKTLLVRSLAQVLGCEFARVQFTPDLMPADLTGTNVFNFQRSEFTLVKGPIFTTFLLADEINRAPAKTQAGLLQAMQERCVTIDRQTYPLSPDFTVFATQNPIEFEGTYPLPEAQRDRFMLCIRISYPKREEEVELARRSLGENAPEMVLAQGAVKAVVETQDLADFRRFLRELTVQAEVVEYAVDLVQSTRSHEMVLLGGSPRATQSLLLASRAFAALQGRDFVTPDDLRSMALPTLGHRIILRPEYEIEGVTIEEVIEKVFGEVTVPR